MTKTLPRESTEYIVSETYGEERIAEDEAAREEPEKEREEELEKKEKRSWNEKIKPDSNYLQKEWRTREACVRKKYVWLRIINKQK